MTAKSSIPEVHEDTRGGKNTQPQKLMDLMSAKGAASPKKRVAYLQISMESIFITWSKKEMFTIDVTKK